MLGKDALHRITEIVSSGASKRGPSALCTDDLWAAALRLIGAAQRICIITGFFIASANAPETDGPTGSVALAGAFQRIGVEAEIWTDSRCIDAVLACAASVSFPEGNVFDVSDPAFAAKTPGLLIYVERLGRAANGFYYDMRGQNVSEFTYPLDEFALKGGYPVIGIGDGGNEVGMGNYNASLSKMMPDYAKCLSSIRADVCIPADVSNWGAYALVAALSCERGKWLGQTNEEEITMIEALAAAGAVDGVTKKQSASVDGFGVSKHLEIVSSLRDLL